MNAKVVCGDFFFFFAYFLKTLSRDFAIVLRCLNVGYFLPAYKTPRPSDCCFISFNGNSRRDFESVLVQLISDCYVPTDSLWEYL